MFILTALLVLVGLVGWPAPAGAQLDLIGTVTGPIGPGITTVLGGTGPLTGTPGALDASALTGQIPGLISAEVLHAATIGDPGQVDSEASIANVALDLPGVTLDADFVIAHATAILGAAGTGSAAINNLLINGVLVAVSGAPNQTIALIVGQVVINEQISSPTGIVVNALHVTVPGAADVIIGSATADAFNRDRTGERGPGDRTLVANSHVSGGENMRRVARVLGAIVLVVAPLLFTWGPAGAQSSSQCSPPPVDFLTGGGFILLPDANGNPVHANFGVGGGCKEGGDGHGLWGHLEYIDRGSTLTGGAMLKVHWTTSQRTRTMS